MIYLSINFIIFYAIFIVCKQEIPITRRNIIAGEKNILP